MKKGGDLLWKRKRELLDWRPKLPNTVTDPEKNQQVEYTTTLAS